MIHLQYSFIRFKTNKHHLHPFTMKPVNAAKKVCAFVASAFAGRRSADLHRCIDGIGALLDRLLVPWENMWRVCVLPFVRRNLWWLADVVSLFLGKGYDVYELHV